MNANKTVSVLALAIVVSGCNRAPVTQTEKATPALPPGFVVDLTPAVDESRLKVIENHLALLDQRVDELLTATAIVNMESQGYAIVRTPEGPFAVKNMGLTPYLDGYKVRIGIGNLTTATFHGVKVKAEWGLALDPKHLVESFEAHQKSRKKREFDLTTVLRPGVYNAAEITLTPAKPEEVKSIEIGLELNLMALR